MHANGFKWFDRISYLKRTNWYPSNGGTVYYFNEGKFGNLFSAEKQGHKILEWSDYRDYTSTYNESIEDMIAEGCAVLKELWKEKIGDNIDYLLILWAMATKE